MKPFGASLLLLLFGLTLQSSVETQLSAAGATGSKTAIDRPIVTSHATYLDSARKVPRGRFSVGTDTTYFTMPLATDGYFDFATVVNDKLREGVAPDCNANVVLCKALGPDLGGNKVSSRFFQILGVEPPSIQGEYFVDLATFTKQRIRGGLNKEKEELEDQLKDQLNDARQRPWISNKYPHLAEWLKDNEKPLAVALQGSRRSGYFCPIVLTPTVDKPAESLRVPPLWIQQCWGLCQGLLARGMLRTGEADFREAWQDLIGCHRLSRLIARGGTLAEGLAGIGVDLACFHAELAFLEASRPNASQIESYLRDLENLAAFPELSEKIGLAERCYFLDSVMRVDREGLRHLKMLEGNEATQGNHPLDSLLIGIDWDPALRNGNRWYDRLVRITQDKNRYARREEFERITAELAQLRLQVFQAGGLNRLTSCEPAQRGKLVGDILLPILLPAVGKCQDALERERQRYQNLLLAFRIARYERDHGSYPNRLEDLVPKLLSQVPQDFFSDKPLIYRRTKDGYLLYSVGVDGIDEDGHGPQDDPPGDDIVVQMPLGKPLRR
jgi:hypothetical protein